MLNGHDELCSESWNNGLWDKTGQYVVYQPMKIVDVLEMRDNDRVRARARAGEVRNDTSFCITRMSWVQGSGTALCLCGTRCFMASPSLNQRRPAWHLNLLLGTENDLP